jgi:hypothetical protein
MSPVDVETVNERLNGLVNLLKAVGVDSFDETNGGINYGSGGKRTSTPDARQLDDDQIAAIIKKLQMAQSEAPQIIAALEEQAKMKRRQQQQQQQQQRHQHVEEEVEEEEDDDEDEDSYDDDANYPVVGPGCSDDVSVVSDLTTPTVVQNPHVSEDEYYRENNALPPMLIIGNHNGTGTNSQHPPMLIAPTKRKNLVGSVRTNTLATAPRGTTGNGSNGIKATSSNKGNGGIGGSTALNSSNGGSSSKGAAAQRRKVYNATMERLGQEGVGNGDGGIIPQAPPSPSPRSPSSRAYPISPSRSSGSNGNLSHPMQQASRKVKPPATSNSHNQFSPPQQPQKQRPMAINQSSFNQPSASSNPDVRKVSRRSSLTMGQTPVPRQTIPNDTANNWDVPPGWDTFQQKAASNNSSKHSRKNMSTPSTSFVDDDGFLMAPTTDFDPFATSSSHNQASKPRKVNDNRSVNSGSGGSGSRKSSGSDPVADSVQQRRIKKPVSSQVQPQHPSMMKPSSAGGYNKSHMNGNAHFVDQPPQRSRPQPQQQQQQQQQQPPPPQQQYFSSAMIEQREQQQAQQQAPKTRRVRRASLGM